jgi:hypothetical protein
VRRRRMCGLAEQFLDTLRDFSEMHRGAVSPAR